jgi:hypothetical protein
MCIFSLITASLRCRRFHVRLRPWRNVNADRRLHLVGAFRVQPSLVECFRRLRRAVNLCIANDTFLICGNANDVLMVPTAKP